MMAAPLEVIHHESDAVWVSDASNVAGWVLKFLSRNVLVPMLTLRLFLSKLGVRGGCVMLTFQLSGWEVHCGLRSQSFAPIELAVALYWGCGNPTGSQK